MRHASRSVHGTPHQRRSTKDFTSIESEASDLKVTSGKSEVNMSSSAEEYTKLLRRRMISEVLKGPQEPIWRSPGLNSRPAEATPSPRRSEATPSPRKPAQKRSQSAQGRKNNNAETKSEVLSTPAAVRARGLGRRSATQMELSRRKHGCDLSEAGAKWHSQENLNENLKVSLTCLIC